MIMRRLICPAWATASAVVLVALFWSHSLLAQRVKEFDEEPVRKWLPPLMGDPTKLSPDRYVNDEYPSATLDEAGRLWVVWSSCRSKDEKWPASSTQTMDWEWPDDGQDSIVVRAFEGNNWTQEQIVSAVPGVNHKPVVVSEPGGIRVLWTARRNGRWAAYERSWRAGNWSRESRVPGSADTLEVRARPLTDGTLLAVFRKLVPPRIELHARLYRNGRWESGVQLDGGAGRCFRPRLLALPPDRWLVAWDEERRGNYDIFVRGSNSSAQRLTTSSLWDTAPAVARLPGGQIWVAWERRETKGGRFNYRGRSIFGKVLEAGEWKWAPSPFPKADPGRLTRHSRFWAAHGISEERYPQLMARANGDLLLFWLGGGRMSSVSFTGRVWGKGRWSEPRSIFHDLTPYTAFQLPSVRSGVELRSSGQGPYQTPLANQMALVLDDPGGRLWMAYEVPKRRHITDRLWNWQVLQRPTGYGADIYCHQVDLDEREIRFPKVVDDLSPVPPLTASPYRDDPRKTLVVDGKEYKLVWGDMHGHTENDGIGSFDMFYAHGLFVTDMDFVASANHDFTPDFLTQSEWAQIQALAGVYNRLPGRVAFSGWEWTTMAQDERGGHRAMYFLNDDGPLYRSTTASSNTVWKLFSLLRGQQVILQPHHNDWTGYDPELQPVFEITSAWRQPREETTEFKSEGPVSAVWEALERGYRIGFVGSGDSHWLGTGEDFGITGAYVEQFTREGVFEAIRGKRVFASTGARILIDFRVNGAFMGSQLKAEGAVRVDVDVTGDAELATLEIVKDHRVIHAAEGGGLREHFRYIDYAGPRPDGKASYYYLRVKQTDGMSAWTSPVWVDWPQP